MTVLAANEADVSISAAANRDRDNDEFSALDLVLIRERNYYRARFKC